MRKLLIATITAVLLASPAFASDESDVMAVVFGFVNAFNKGDVNSVLATCAEQTSIIDEFPPHEWHGAGACGKWAGDYDADAKKNNITDGAVKLHKPRHVDVTGDHAYVVVAADYSFRKNGKPMKETASTLTIAMEKSKGAWHITAWSWAKQ